MRRGNVAGQGGGRKSGRRIQQSRNRSRMKMTGVLSQLSRAIAGILMAPYGAGPRFRWP